MQVSRFPCLFLLSPENWGRSTVPSTMHFTLLIIYTYSPNAKTMWGERAYELQQTLKLSRQFTVLNKRANITVIGNVLKQRSILSHPSAGLSARQKTNRHHQTDDLCRRQDNCLCSLFSGPHKTESTLERTEVKDQWAWRICLSQPLQSPW